MLNIRAMLVLIYLQTKLAYKIYMSDTNNPETNESDTSDMDLDELLEFAKNSEIELLKVLESHRSNIYVNSEVSSFRDRLPTFCPILVNEKNK